MSVTDLRSQISDMLSHGRFNLRSEIWDLRSSPSRVVRSPPNDRVLRMPFNLDTDLSPPPIARFVGRVVTNDIAVIDVGKDA